MTRIDLTEYPPGALVAACVACGDELVCSPKDMPEPQCADLDACAEDVAEKALEAYGLDAQVDVVVEELAELITAIQQYKRGRVTLRQLAAEIADVRNVLPIAEHLIISGEGSSVLLEERQKKLRRMGERLRGSRP